MSRRLIFLAAFGSSMVIGCGEVGGPRDGGSMAGGSTSGGSTAGGTAGGSTAGGSTAGGSTAGGSTAGGSTAGGSTAGGSTAGGSTAGGSTAGGSTAGGAAGGTAGGATSGGTAGGGRSGGAAGGATSGGTAGGGRAGGAAGGATSGGTAGGARAGGTAGGATSGGTAGGGRAGGAAGGATSGGTAGGARAGGTAGGSTAGGVTAGGAAGGARAGGSAGGATAGGTAGGSGQTGLEWPLNGVAGSDARLVWSGANILPRCPHTAIWKARYIHTAGYYAVAWHTSNDGTWHASPYEFGTHPYPTTGTVNSDGQSTGGTGSVGLVQYYEIAGLGASDFIASPGPGPTYLVVKGIWVTQARTCEIVGSLLRHRYWPDVTSPSGYIEQTYAKSAVDQATTQAVSPAFIIGSSPWTGSGAANGESPNAVLRGFAFFNATLSIADIISESATDSNTPVTSAGAASVWYINKNPTVGDVTDKSGAGHSPTWANSQRPRPYP